MTTSQIWMLVAAGLLVPFAGVFSASTTALSRTTLPRASKLSEEGRRGADALAELMTEPGRTLNLVALLELSTHVAVTALVTGVAVVDLQRGPGLALAAVATTIVLFVVAIVAPRTMAVRDTEGVACAVAPALRLLARVLSPIVGLLVKVGGVIAPVRGLPSGPFVTEDELRDMIDAAGSEEVIEESERVMIHSIFELDETVAREIMTPRPDMVSVSTDDDLSTVVDVTLEAGHSRLPVIDRERDEVVGLVYAKDVLARLHHEGSESGHWSDLLRPALFVPELVRIGKLLADLQSQTVHMAIVVDEYGGTAGLVTIEDVLEEIVGEITDEYDRAQPLMAPLDDGVWRIDARLPVDDLGELLDVDLPEDWDTVGGLLFGTLGHIPEVGEDVIVGGVRLVAERVTGRRVAQVRVESPAHAPDPDGPPSDDAGGTDGGDERVLPDPPSEARGTASTRGAADSAHVDAAVPSTDGGER